MKKLPTAKKKLKGTLKKSRTLPDEVSFSVVLGIPDPPTFFGDIAIREWNHLIPELKRAGVLESVDLPQLKLYCYNIQIMELCAEMIAKNGLISKITNKGGHSYEIPSHYVKMMNDATMIVNRIAGKFGFDPAARTKVGERVPLSKPVVPDAKSSAHPFEDAISGKTQLKVAK